MEAWNEQERRTLRIVLGINAVMFLFEIVLGWLAQSTGLIADSLDMLADALVYAISLYAVGRADVLKDRAARLSGMLQIGLAVLVLADVLRRFFYGSEPVSMLMMSVGAVALVANSICLLLIARHRDGGVHMRASLIFSANDVIANLGVIVSGGLVWLLGSRYPDLFIGFVIAGLVMYGGLRILREVSAHRAKGSCSSGSDGGACS
jgi:cation diffusion facilitator family transporter